MGFPEPLAKAILSMTNPTPGKLDTYSSTRGLAGKRVILPDADDLIGRLAANLQEAARHRIRRAGIFHLALSGGSTPQPLYQRLMIDPLFRNFPWPRTHVWLVDERCVELDDDRSNYKVIREMIVDHSGIPPRQVHPMPVPDAVGDRRYEDELRAALDNTDCRNRLDFILLGMGGDGHTASLFPRTPALRETEHWVMFNDGEAIAAPRPRMTMTYPLINGARSIAVLVTGESKRAALQHASLAASSGGDIQRLPITGVQPIHEDGEMTWYLDHAAAVGPEV